MSFVSSSAFSTSKCTLLPARWSALEQVPLIVVVFKTPVRAECNWDTLQFLNLSSCMPCVQPVTRELSLSLTLPVLPLLSSCVWQHEVQWLSQIMCPFPQTVWCVFPQKLWCVCLVCVCVCMRVCVCFPECESWKLVTAGLLIMCEWSDADKFEICFVSGQSLALAGN